MTIASEITRLQGAKADIKTSIENKGVSVSSIAKLDTYDTYIDQIQQGVPTEDYDTVLAVSKGATIGYPDISYINKYWGFGGDAYLCKIGNYLFMIGGYGRHYSSSGLYEYFDSYVGIYYKIEGANSWSWVRKFLGNSSSRTSTDATVRITPVYIESNNSVNMKVEVAGNRGDILGTYYVNWEINSNSITDSSLLTGEDLNNYKIYNSSISVWEIDPNDIYAIGYKIDEPLL